MEQKKHLLLKAIQHNNTEEALEYLMDPALIAYLMRQPDIGEQKIIFVLECTACRGNVAVLNRLLEIPNTAWLITFCENRLLGLAALNNRLHMVQRLLQFSLVIIQMNWGASKSAGLHTAAERGDLAMIHLLIEKISNSSHKKAQGMHALNVALDPNTFRPEVAYIIAQWLWPKGQKEMWADKEVLALNSDRKQKLQLMSKQIIDTRAALLSTYNRIKNAKSDSIGFIHLPLEIWQQYILPFLYTDEKEYEGKNQYDNFTQMPLEKRVFFMYGLKSMDHFELICKDHNKEKPVIQNKNHKLTNSIFSLHRLRLR